MTDKQEFLVTCSNEEELNKLKEKAMKLKLIVLDNWDKHPLQNPSLFNKRQKDKFTAELKSLWNTMTNEQIDKEFNDICCSRLFEVGCDISTYPIYEPAGTPNHDVLFRAEEDISIN